jgi:hypothetical protein
MNQNSTLTEKLQTLTSEQIAEVENFVAFLQFQAQDRAVVRASAGASEPAFERVWNNPEDDAYDALAASTLR